MNETKIYHKTNNTVYRGRILQCNIFDNIRVRCVQMCKFDEALSIEVMETWLRAVRMIQCYGGGCLEENPPHEVRTQGVYIIQ